MTQSASLPNLVTDCHTHLVGEPTHYPMVSPRSYTPALASPADMRAMMDRVGIARIVVVQISVFGTDNSCMLDGMRVLGDCARGVVQVDEGVTGAALDDMHAAGVRGIRVNLNTLGVRDPDEARRRLDAAADICARNGWHLQTFSSPAVISAIGSQLRDLPVALVIDHFGLLSVADRGGEAERTIMDLLGQGKAWVKISGTYRLDQPEATARVASLARDLYQANPERIVWGSDWPHPPAHNSTPEADPQPLPYRDIDPARMLATIPEWFEDAEDQTRILVTNPARLYDFPLSGS